MKIERVNENQIRCTLTKDDLAQRSIKISELAYGSEKAKMLFRDMMHQARKEVGFEADDIPLMIEAIPYSESIVLVITKVEDPEELDTRFSNFAPSVMENNSSLSDLASKAFDGEDDVLNLFKKMHDSIQAKEESVDKKEESSDVEFVNSDSYLRLFSFASLSDVTRIAQLIGKNYLGNNTLYKNTQKGGYILIAEKGDHTEDEFNRFCNMTTEYAQLLPPTNTTERFFAEHGKAVIEDTALQTLATI